MHDDTPAVHVDQLSLAELAKASWVIGFIRLAERWLGPWRTNANAAWSIGPHTGVDKAAEGTMGAGELWFTPPIRL